uniref:hypothetical protein n=1 Tax=Chamaesiphon sp. OTE_8_metabat_110 TaxID=2964696 RepID=UPI00286D4787
VAGVAAGAVVLVASIAFAKGTDAVTLLNELLLFGVVGAANAGLMATRTPVKTDPSIKDAMRPI